MEYISPKSNTNINSEEVEEFESSSLEKLIGVFVEPLRIFRSISQFGAKSIDWLLPLLFFLLTLILSDLMVTSIPSIRYSMLEKQALNIRNKLEPLVEQGLITPDRINTQIEKLKKNYDEGLTVNKIKEAGYITFFEFIRFLVTLLVFHFILKFLYPGKIEIKKSLVALGLPFYIKAFGNVILIMAGLITSAYYQDLSIASIIGADRSTTLGFILGKLDLFAIWYFLIVSFGFLILHNLREKYKVIIIVFGIWLTSGLFFFWVSKIVTNSVNPIL